MLCDDCWMPAHDGECPLTTLLPMIVPNMVTEDDVKAEVPEGVVVEFFRNVMTSVVIVRSQEPFDSRKVVAAMKTWIEPDPESVQMMEEMVEE